MSRAQPQEYVFAVRELAEANGDSNIYRLARRLGVTDSRASQLWNGSRLSRIGRETIALVCSAYGCTPNDFIRPATGGAKLAAAKKAADAPRKKPARS